MKKFRKSITGLLLTGVICLGLCGCGSSDQEVIVDSGENPSPSANVFVKTGTISTDSWGYTGSSPIQITLPGQTDIVIKEHTLLVDASKTVVSGTTNTRISYSSDKSTLTAAAQASAPANANFLSYVNILIGPVKSVFPALSVTVDVGAVLAGTTLTVYYYDPDTSRWLSGQTAIVSSSGKITFPLNQLSLLGIFR